MMKFNTTRLYFPQFSGSEGVLMVDPHNPAGTTIHSVTKSGTRTEQLLRSLQDRQNDAFSAAVRHFVDVVQGNVTYTIEPR